MDWIVPVVAWLDALAAGSVLPLAVWILVSGLDDLFLNSLWIAGLFRKENPLCGSDTPGRKPDRWIAILLPCWREDKVIGAMLEHNLAAIRYTNYSIFAGAYPNDQPTQAAILAVAARFPKVRLCVCPHPGPTSKADCLNWIYQHIQREEERGISRFDILITHDAEDLIHPDELHWANRLIGDYDMVQTPVLPLQTPCRELIHGLYCDDFAEMHTKDLAVRWRQKGFIPSSGVGTAYRRSALEQMPGAKRDRIFEPECLTEDYEIGLRLHLSGCRQLFVPLQPGGPTPLATREFFPRQFRLALRQRTRWVTGISLQSWQRHGWGKSPRQWYWLWRDRKGLLGNPLSLYANVLFVYSLFSYWVAQRLGMACGAERAISEASTRSLLWATGVVALFQLAIRGICSARVYGARFALFVPVRSLLGNLLNSLATMNALCRFASVMVTRQRLPWLKTEHVYPTPAALTAHQRPLGEILVSAGFLKEEVLARALASKPGETALGDHLVQLGLIKEETLTEALSRQSGMPAEVVDPQTVLPQVARALPGRLQREQRLIAVKMEAGQLHLASPGIPGDGVEKELRKHTSLKLRFVLVTPHNYRELCEKLL